MIKPFDNNQDERVVMDRQERSIDATACRQGITHDETGAGDIGTFRTAVGADVFSSILLGIYLPCRKTGVVCSMRFRMHLEGIRSFHLAVWVSGYAY